MTLNHHYDHLSDKCGSHAYDYAYARYLEPILLDATEPMQKIRIFEVGLGCGQPNLGVYIIYQ